MINLVKGDNVILLSFMVPSLRGTPRKAKVQLRHSIVDTGGKSYFTVANSRYAQGDINIIVSNRTFYDSNILILREGSDVNEGLIKIMEFMKASATRLLHQLGQLQDDTKEYNESIVVGDTILVETEKVHD